MSACFTCGAPTDCPSRLCDSCISDRVDAERTAQGLPLAPSAETMDRVARLLAPVWAEQTKAVAS